MIVNLDKTSTTEISKKLVQLRNEVGSMTIGRVMTLVAVCRGEDVEESLHVAAEATRLHPSRIIALVADPDAADAWLDAEIRLGGDAGASEIIVLRLHGDLAQHGASALTPLLLADSPVVAWWPMEADENIGETPIGRMAQRRITDASLSADPRSEILRRAMHYTAGDTDVAWARTTRWRGLLAGALDVPPYEPVTKVIVTGASDSASTDLLGGWLGVELGCPVERRLGEPGLGLISVELERASGPITLTRHGEQAILSQPGQPDRQMALQRPDAVASLAEELRRLDKDEVYRDALVRGLPKLVAEDDA